MPLLTHSLRTGARGLVLFAVAIAAIGSFYLSFFASMADLMSAKSEMMKAMSPGMLKALGMEDLSNGANYAQAAFLGLLGFVLLVAAMTAWAASVTAGPEETGELELTLAHGVGRSRVLLERVGALVLKLIVLALVAGAVLAAFNQWGELGITWSHIPAGVAAWAGLGLLCAMAGAAVGALTGRRSAAIAASVGVAVIGYMLNAVGAQSADNEWMLDLSPYAWAFRHTPLAEGWDWPGLGLLYGGAVVLLLIGLLAFSRRDIGR